MYTKFEHFGIIRFRVMLQTLVLTLTLTLTLTFDLSTKTIPLTGYPNFIPYTKFEHFGVIRFLSYAADKQTYGLKNPTHAD